LNSHATKALALPRKLILLSSFLEAKPPENSHATKALALPRDIFIKLGQNP